MTAAAVPVPAGPVDLNVAPTVPSGPDLPRYAWRPVAAVAIVVGALLAVTANSYGYHRDELYFRMLAAHPAWGYVDEPPMTPMLVRASTALFGDSLWALRVPAILFAVATVMLVALLCRELGGNRLAQVLAAFGGAGAFPLIAGHVFLTATPDLAVWVLVVLFACRALLRDEPRWWLAAGATVGIGLYNKQLVALLLIGLAVGLLIAGPRRPLVNRWLWAGVGLAIVIALPTLIYQATNGWPELHMANAISTDKGGDDRVMYVPFQLILLGPPMVPIWIAGLVGLFRDPRWRPIRSLGWAYQVYYTFGLLALYYAAGCVRVSRWVRTEHGFRRGRFAWVIAALALSAITAIPIALPIVPLGSLGASGIGAINQTTRDQVGWPAYVHEVAAAYAALPAADRSHAAVIAENYGEAGAIDRYGPADGLPSIVYSGQNQLYFYGPPPAADDIAMIVGADPGSRLASLFATCETADTLNNRVDVDNEEQGRVILVCRKPTGPWSAVWPSFQHYS
jgi:4-amino-4-deoxy-L-arabinose transferase-like glycosyltransferase